MVTVAGASANSQTVAAQLATYLGRTGSPAPSVQAHSGQDGIRVGLWSEWHAIDAAIPDHGSSWDYVCEKVGNQYYILGRTDRGLQLALSAFLYNFGYHRLHTGPDWEIPPVVGFDVNFPTDVAAAAAQLQVIQGLGNVFLMDDAKPAVTDRQTSRYTEYTTQIGLISDGLYQTGHAWGAARQKFAAQFAAHPEWVAGPNPNVANPKFACYDTALQAQMLAYALTLSSGRKAVSMSASDGSDGWALDCSGTHEQLTHTPPDRNVTLANAVVAGLRTAGQTAKVAVLCYAELCIEPSPGITIDSDVICVWATSFMVQGYTAERARDGWLSHGAVLHMPYSYPAIWTVGYGLPPGGRSFKRSELQVEVERMSSTGVGTAKPIGWSGESTGAELVHARWHRSLVELMFGRSPTAFWDAYPAIAFPSAVAEAQAFYALLYGGRAFSGDLIHRLADAALTLLTALGSATNNTAEIRRARSLGIVVYHFALFRVYQQTPSGATMDSLLAWVSRSRELDCVNYSAWYDEPNFAVDRQKAAALHPGHPTDLSKNSVNWPDTPIGDAELRANLTTAIANNQLMPFIPRGFSSDLVRVGGLAHVGPRGSFAFESGTHRWVLHAAEGMIFSFQGAIGAKGASTFVLREVASGEVVWQADIPNDNVPRDTSAGVGYYPTLDNLIPQRVYYVEATIRDAVAWHWQAGTGMVCQPDETKALFSGNSQWFFYVDTQATVVGYFAQAGTLTFEGPDGSTIAVKAAPNDYDFVPVPDGLAGVPWRVKGVSAKFGLLTVPPQLAFDENELLLPTEIVDQDGLTVADATPAPSPPYTPESFSTTLVRPIVPLIGTGRPRGNVLYYTNVGVIGYLYATSITTIFQANGGIIPTASGTTQVRFTDLTDATTQTISITNETGLNGAQADYPITTVIGRQYKIELLVKGKSCQLEWGPGVIVSAYELGLATTNTPPAGGVNGCFYVRKNATVVGWYGDGGTVHLYDNVGHLITTVTNVRDYHQVPVPAGMDGKVWFFTGFSNRFEMQAGGCPTWAMAPGELLIPQDIAAADGL